ncbi:DNA methyltransferase [Neisseriaceae bacterium B1]
MQVKSKQRVADHGEVYTHEREVNAMLDLVADQATNPEKTFLEPACGSGNFLAEILRRKLAAIAQKHKKSQLHYERNAIIAVGSIYGIELLPDNVAECCARLHGIFAEYYQAVFPKTFKPECLRAAQYILSQNILCGDALKLETADGKPIVFSEWKPLNGILIKRRDYVYLDLVNKASERELPLFSDLGDEAYVPSPLKEYDAVHFLEVGNV